MQFYADNTFFVSLQEDDKVFIRDDRRRPLKLAKDKLFNGRASTDLVDSKSISS